mgnify:CR=1 FL=1
MFAASTYEEIERIEESKLLLFSKPGKKHSSMILFDFKEKTILGFIKPEGLMYSIDDYSSQYGDFLKLKQDVEKLAKLSNYEIIKI